MIGDDLLPSNAQREKVLVKYAQVVYSDDVIAENSDSDETWEIHAQFITRNVEPEIHIGYGKGPEKKVEQVEQVEPNDQLNPEEKNTPPIQWEEYDFRLYPVPIKPLSMQMDFLTWDRIIWYAQHYTMKAQSLPDAILPGC